MSHEDARKLERILKREGTLDDFVLVALEEMSQEEFGLILYRAMELRRTRKTEPNPPAGTLCERCERPPSASHPLAQVAPGRWAHGRSCASLTRREIYGDGPREITIEEGRELLLDHFRHMVSYWAREDRVPGVREKLSGMVHSILCTFDGSSGGMPAFDIVPASHPGDQAYHEENEENWWGSQVINGDVHLHSLWNEPERLANTRKHQEEKYAMGLCQHDDCEEQAPRNPETGAPFAHCLKHMIPQTYANQGTPMPTLGMGTDKWLGLRAVPCDAAGCVGRRAYLDGVRQEGNNSDTCPCTDGLPDAQDQFVALEARAFRAQAAAAAPQAKK